MTITSASGLATIDHHVDDYITRAEQLRRPENLSRWLAETGLARQPPVATDDDLRQARSLREAIDVVSVRGCPV